MTGMAVEDPKLPMLELTAARVSEPPDLWCWVLEIEHSVELEEVSEFRNYARNELGEPCFLLSEVDDAVGGTA
jgi:hypothetical protein